MFGMAPGIGREACNKYGYYLLMLFYCCRDSWGTTGEANLYLSSVLAETKELVAQEMYLHTLNVFAVSFM